MWRMTFFASSSEASQASLLFSAVMLSHMGLKARFNFVINVGDRRGEFFSSNNDMLDCMVSLYSDRVKFALVSHSDVNGNVADDFLRIIF